MAEHVKGSDAYGGFDIGMLGDRRFGLLDPVITVTHEAGHPIFGVLGHFIGTVGARPSVAKVNGARRIVRCYHGRRSHGHNRP